jgi:hypothetical protein
MTKHKGAMAIFSQVSAGKFHWARIMIPLNPNPLPPGLHTVKTRAFRGIKTVRGLQIIKTIPQTNHNLRGQSLNFTL